MLRDNNAIPNLAVKDIGRAKRFYEDVLGLTPAGGEGDEVAAYRSGSSTIWVYRSDFAGTNKATAAAWEVDDIDETVRDLKAKGVGFEHYDFPGMHHEGDVHVADDGGMRIAWFKDPDGNILSLVGG